MSIVTSRQPLLPTAACTLNLTAHDLAHRKYGRLWAPGVQLERRRTTIRWPVQPRYCEPHTMIVDVGSFVGDDLVKFLSRCTANLTVHTFEPVRMLRDQLLERRARLAHPEYLQSHAFGLGDSNRSVCFGQARMVGAAGTMALSSPHQRSASACVAPGWIVDAAHTLRRFARIDLLQINCEGCEYEVLERLLSWPASSAQSPLAAVRAIEVQFHLAIGPQSETSRYCRIEERLRERGYSLDYRFPFTWERWSRRRHAAGPASSSSTTTRCT